MQIVKCFADGWRRGVVVSVVRRMSGWAMMRQLKFVAISYALTFG